MVDAPHNSYLVFIRHAASVHVILTRCVLICPNRINRARLIVLNRATEIEKNAMFRVYTVSFIYYVYNQVIGFISDFRLSQSCKGDEHTNFLISSIIDM